MSWDFVLASVSQFVISSNFTKTYFCSCQNFYSILISRMAGSKVVPGIGNLNNYYKNQIVVCYL